MKSMKRIASVVLAMVMILAMAVPVMAAEEQKYTITISPGDTGKIVGHTYEAYQIFKGRVDKVDGKEILSDIAWGDGVNGEALLKALKAEEPVALGGAYKECADAAAVAKVLANASNADAVAFAKFVAEDYLTDTTSYSTGEIAEESKSAQIVVPAGYYLIRDKDGSLEDKANEAYTEFILQVVGDANINPKADVPSSKKKVKDTNDSKVGSTTDWQDSADHDIGDPIDFQLTGKLPTNFDAYDTYKLVFHDKQSPGLTFVPESVKVYLDGEEVTSGYTVNAEGPYADGCTFEIEITDVKQLVTKTQGQVANNGSEITVEYKSTLNESAVLGSAGNPNTMHMEYSNNPNVGGEGDTSTTPDDTVIVFTYELDINKVHEMEDGTTEALAGAAFKLEKYNGTAWEVVKSIEAGDTTTFTFTGLDDGYYRLTETETPAGYNTIDPIYFEITADHEVLSDSPTLEELTAKQKDAGTDGTITGDLPSGKLPTFKATCTPEDGSIKSDVVNKEGTTLPETGGIGTTIFYVVGAILVIGAGVLLVARKRMNREQ